jgi:tRNA A37 threonylcarbamoyladenosine dehydratase
MSQSQFDRLDVAEFNRRLEAMAQRVGELATAVAVMAERDKQLTDGMEEVKHELGVMKDIFAKGRGAVFILTLAASILATTIALWDKVPKPWAH